MAGLIPRFSHTRTKVRTWNPDEEVDLAIGESGIEAEEPINVGQLFKNTLKEFSTHVALKYKESGKWKAITYSEYYNHCIRAAKSFLKLGVKPNHVVAIFGSNSPEWVISTLGAMFAGGLPAGIFDTYNPDDNYFVANNCQANIIVVEKVEQVDGILQIRDKLKLPQLKAIVQYKGKLSKELCSQNYHTKEYHNWDEFLKLGDETDTNVMEEKIMSQKPNKCALLIYTPGTTGYPKGVMLSHDNLIFTAKALELTFGELIHGQERGVSYLPLASIAAQMADIYLPLLIGATVYYAQPDALNGSLVQTLREVKPTFFFGVPRVYEKMMDDLQKSQSLQADAICEKLGFQECKIFAVGSAPMCRRIHDYFNSIKIPLREVYGMSESSGPHTLGPIPQKDVHVGSCGEPIKGVKQKKQKIKKGHHEIWLYGRHVFMGYLNDKEKTLGCLNNGTLDTWIDSDGWLHSGDIGEIEDDFLYITGRKKDIIILSSGANIHPVPIEMRIKNEIPFVRDVIVVGDKRQFLTCLMTLKRDYGNPQYPITPRVQQLIKAFGSPNAMTSKIVAKNDLAVSTAIWVGIWKANMQADSQEVWVQNWTLLSEFPTPGGELGPTLKMKHHAVQEMYKKEIESMYSDQSGESAIQSERKLNDEESGSSVSSTLPEQMQLNLKIKSLEDENEKLRRQHDQDRPKSSYDDVLGVEVVGKKVLVVRNEALSFKWKDHGFKLHVQDKSLPEGIPEYSVTIKASLAGQFELPEGYELVSAVYWVKTSGKFTKPITIEVQHCANVSKRNQLHFVSTSHAQKSLPYKFECIDGGSFALGNTYGALSTKHFCGIGVAKKVEPSEPSCKYCAQVYFTVKTLKEHWYYCHFVITKALEMCLAVAKRKYQQEYDIAPSITFGSDQVALDIPDDGTQTDNGWEIVPVQKAHVEKDRVDDFSSESTWVPECVLLLKWKQKDTAPQPLIYKVKLKGTGKEGDFFRIVYNPETESVRKIQAEGEGATHHHQQQQPAEDRPVERPQAKLKSHDKPTLPQLLKFPGKEGKIDIPERIGANYKLFGIFLLKDDNGTKVEAITKEEEKVHDISLKILSKWLRGEGIQPPTWSTLTEVLKDSNFDVLAEEIETVIKF